MEIKSYSTLWKAVIRPPRFEYELRDLGPRDIVLNNKRIRRTDLELQGHKGQTLQCSHYEPVEADREWEELPCVIYLHGNGKQLANMDIDCDGQQGGAGEDGRCGSSGDTQSQTSFKDTIIDYKVGISDLNAKVHTYVVFGNDGTSPSFDPQKYGIEPLSVMAVVCGNKLVRTRFLLHLNPQAGDSS